MKSLMARSSSRATGAVRGAQPRVRSSVASRPSVNRPAGRKVAVEVKAFFSFLTPKAPAAGPKAAELVEELVELIGTKRASAADVNKLVAELAPLGIKNPVRSKLLFGTYKLVFSTKAGAAIGTRQVLEEPGTVREVSEVKVLGLLPGTQTQSGELNGVSGDTYEELYDKVEVKAAVGGESKAVDVARLVQVVYLDAELRVVRIKQEGEAGEGSLAVYQRVVEDGEEDDEEEEAGPGKQAGGFFGAFGSSAPKEGTATIAEREVLRKLAAAKSTSPRLPANLPSSPAAAVKAASAARGGTVKVAPPPPAPARGRSPSPAPPAARGGTVKVDARGAAAEGQRREAEAKAKAKEAALAKEKAEAEKRAAAERQGAIRSLLEQLSEQLKEAQAEAREAAKEAKDLERANGAVLKQVAGARLQLRSAADEVDKVEAALSQAGQARQAAEQALKQALAGVSEAKAKAARK